jgi:prepilin-type N-terminal cleavage/methylation domain-containing protein
MSVGVRSARGARGRGAAGFTLLELLVVVIIIGVVAALAVPSMVVARDDRHAYDDAGAIMQLFRTARSHAIARSGAVLVSMSANGTNDRGTFLMYDAVTQDPGSTGGPYRLPVSSCKTPTVWDLSASNPGVLLVDGVNLNGTAEARADIETQAFVYPDPTNNTATAFLTGYLCYTPLGRSYLYIGVIGKFVFDGLLPTLSPLEFRVSRATGGNIRSVLVPPNGMARLFSHL